MAKHSVLLVDDTESNRILYGKLLEKAGYRVILASDGPEALERVAESLPDLVLLDYMMPGMDGGEVTRRLRANPHSAHVPIVVLTASFEPQDIETALGAGADDYINKPVDSRILITRIRSIIQASADRVAAQAESERDALRQELQEAQRVQRAQLPQVPVCWPQWMATGVVVPCGQIAGDVFDVVLTPDGRGITCLVDVSGHGAASALVAAETRTRLKDLVCDRPIAQAMTELNERMAEQETGKYACVALIETTETQISVINAGLPPVALLRNGELVQSVMGSGLPVGMFSGSQYEPTRFRVKPGDMVVTLSDGLTEPFGPADDVEGSIKRLALDFPGIIMLPPEVLESRLKQLIGKPSDDATLVLLEHRAALPAQDDERTFAGTLDDVQDAVDWTLHQKPMWLTNPLVASGVTEAVTNAIVHGTLQVESEQREQSLSGYLDQIERNSNAPISRPERLTVHVHSSELEFVVKLQWVGRPCPEPMRSPRSADPLAGHGLGTNIIYASFDEVTWGQDGLSLELVSQHKPRSQRHKA